MLERVILITTAIGMVPRATAGMIRYKIPSQKAANCRVRRESTRTSPVMEVMAVLGPSRPGKGRSARFTPKITTRIMASQKIGMLIPVSARTEVVLSSNEYCLTAEITPTGTPTSTATSMAKATSSKVAGSRTRSSVVTGRPVTMESPRSPLTASLRKRRYCIGTGLSSPILAVRAVTCSWVAFCPRSIWAGSPGMARTIKNTTIDTPSSTGMICKILRPTYSARSQTSVRRASIIPLPSRALLAARESHWVERLAARRVRIEVLYRILKTYGRLDVGDGHPRGVLVHDLLRFVVCVLARAFVYGRLGLQKQFVYLRVLVVRDVAGVFRGRACTVEQYVQEVVRVPVVPRPPEQARRMLPARRLGQIGGPVVGDELGVDADVLEVLLHDLRDALGVGHVGAWDRHVPQLGLEVLDAGVLEQLPGFLRIVWVRLYAVVEERQEGRHVVGGDLSGLSQHGLHQLGHVYGIVESLAYPRVVERFLLVVHRKVTYGVRRPEHQLEPFLLLDCRHVVGHETVGPVELVAGERRDPLGVVGYRADDDLFEVRPTVALARGEIRPPPILVCFRAYLGVPLPLDELVRPAPDRLLPAVVDVLLYGRRRRYGEGRHGEVPRERSLRLLEGELHCVVVNDVDALDDGVVVESPELGGVVGEVRALSPAALVVLVLGVAPAVEVELDGFGVE